MQHFDVLAVHGENIDTARADLLRTGLATVIHHDHDPVRIHLVKPEGFQTVPTSLYASRAERPGVPLTDLVLEKLRSYVREGQGMVVSGGVGVGKTTLMASLCAAIPQNTSIACIEEYGELRLDHPACHRYTYARNAPPTADEHIDVVFQKALLPSPGWVVLGEMQVYNHFARYVEAGCVGLKTLATLHAASHQHALQRMEEGVQRMRPHLSAQAIRAQIAQGTRLSVHLSSPATGKRPLVEVASVRVDAQWAFVFEPIAI